MSKPLKPLYTGLVVLILAGCASAPDKITPTHINEALWTEQTCRELVSEYARTDGDLAVLEKKQTNAARADLAALIIVGIPVTWMYKGNKKDEIAEHKGQVLAIQRAAASNDCSLPPRTSSSVLEPPVKQRKPEASGTFYEFPDD